MKLKRFTYYFLVWVTRVALFVWHPVFKVTGRERIPDKTHMIVSNHAGLADPLWHIYAFKKPYPLYRIVAKESLMRVPLLGILFDRIGMIGIRRGEQDVGAVKSCLAALKNGENVFIYPEGTRVKKSRIQAKTGALMIAERAGVPVLPLFISRRRFPFQPVKVVIGEPFTVHGAGRRSTPEELREQTDAMMDRIYAMGGEG